MLDAHFDINSIFRSEIFVPVAIGILSGLICYVVTGNLLTSAIVTVSVYLVSECIHWIIIQQRRQRYHNSMVRERQEARSLELRRLADNAKVFFCTMNDNQIKIATELYRYQSADERYSNERYVKFGFENSLIYGIDDSLFCDENRCYIHCDNGLSYNNGGPKHIIIDPFFYEILKNYVETGIKAFPEGFDPDSFLTHYPQH